MTSFGTDFLGHIASFLSEEDVGIVNSTTASDEIGNDCTVNDAIGKKSAIGSLASVTPGTPAINSHDDDDDGANANSEIITPSFPSKNLADVPARNARVLIFSKDRPWQLQELLLSMKLPRIDVGSNHCFVKKLDIYVIICTSSPEFERGYDKVIATFEQSGGSASQKGVIACKANRCNLYFFHEDKWKGGDGGHDGIQNEKPMDLVEFKHENAFSQILHYVLWKGTDAIESKSPRNDSGNGELKSERSDGTGTSSCDEDGIVMFLTDDCLLLEPLETILSCAIGALHRYNPKSGQVVNFISRLHPGISWSQTRNVPSPPPREGNMKYYPLPSLPARQMALRNGSSGDNKSYKSNEGHVSCCNGVYLYDRANLCDSVDWNYPFDLSGGVYKHDDALKILCHVQMCDTGSGGSSRSGTSHPNLLEIKGNQVFGSALKPYASHGKVDTITWSAIPTRPFLVVLAVNRVQDVCHAPLALPRIDVERTNGPSTDKTSHIHLSDPKDLLPFLDLECHLDVEKYKSMVYNTSHIGDLYLHNKMDASASIQVKDDATDLPSCDPKISVLIPVHNGPPNAASHAIISVMMQSIDELDAMQDVPGWVKNDVVIGRESETFKRLSPMQIVIVDDRCTDGSIDAMVKSSISLASFRKNLDLNVQDHRDEVRTSHGNGHLKKGTKDASTDNSVISISIDIVSSPGIGVACALNHGLHHCRAELVARMDADDICAPGRLLAQTHFMSTNPSFSVVGSSAVSFSTRTNDTTQSTHSYYRSDLVLPYYSLNRDEKCSTMSTNETCNILQSSLSISDPGFMSWAMLFSCSTCHPSILFRKNVIQDMSGYDESITHCEDYDLWLRLTQQSCRSMICVPTLGLWHRKHDRCNSNKTEFQKKESNVASYNAMKRLLHFAGDDFEVLLEHVSTLRKPNSSLSSGSIDSAAILLQKIELIFVQQNANHLTEQEIKMINMDCNSRIAELATLLVTKFGHEKRIKAEINTRPSWKLWCDRCPNEQLQRLSLLCHLTKMKSDTTCQSTR